MTETMRITNEVLHRHGIGLVPNTCCDQPDCLAGFCGFESCSCICHRYDLALALRPGPNVSQKRSVTWQFVKDGLVGLGSALLWLLGAAVAVYVAIGMLAALACASLIVGIPYGLWWLIWSGRE